MSDDDQKTHDPTPERREKFRKEGRFARARDATAIAACAGALGGIVGTRGSSGRAIEILFTRTLGDVAALGRGEGLNAFAPAMGALGALIVPAALGATLFALVAGFAQAGFRFDSSLFAFKAERLDPLPRLKQLFSKQGIVETALALARVGLVGFVAYQALRDDIPALLGYVSVPVEGAIASLADIILHLALRTGAVLAILAVADYAQNRFGLEKQMKMSLKELKEEMRQSDGDPKLKAKLRAKARQLSKRRMMGDVKKADVIVTNPTHVAVALRYGLNDPAPIVLAKGHDEVALQIRAEARKHGIPIVEARSLARALDGEIAIGQPIRGAHFGAVAQVLAFVYRLRGRKIGTRRA